MAHRDKALGRGSPPLWLLILAAVGATLLLVDAAYRWPTPSDEHAYWLAGQNLLEGRSIYELARLGPVEPYAYHYPPPLAQAMAPIAAVLPAEVWTALWTALLLGCLYWLAGRSLLVALASVAFVPVAAELWFRNIHIPLAAISYLGLRRWPVLLGIGALVKLSPGLGLLYLAAKGRLRDATAGLGVAAVVAAASYALAPDLWREFVDVTLARGPLDISGLLPIPYLARLGIAVLVVLVAARTREPWGDILAIVGMTVALPTLWLDAASFLVACIPFLLEKLDWGRYSPTA